MSDFTCSECGKSLSSNRRLQEHKESQHEQKYQDKFEEWRSKAKEA